MLAERQTITLDELAPILGVGRTLIRKLAREDRLPHPLRVVRIGRRVLVPVVSVEAFLEGGHEAAEDEAND